MTITADNFFSWPVAAWFAVGMMLAVTAWRLMVRMDVMWQRVFFRAGVIALCFVPLPHLLMFAEEGAKAGILVITPLWYALFRSIAEGALLGVGFVLILWLIITYFVWVLGMCLHRLFRRGHAA